MIHLKTRSFNYLSFLWLTLIVTSVSGQTTWHVDINATLTTHDGSAWCSAFLDLQDALDVAINGDTIRIANGTYLPDSTGLANPQEATFHIISGVTIEGGYEGCGVIDPDFRDIVTNPTILSGDLDQNDTTGPTAPGTSDCCTNNPGPGCDDPTCEQIVCDARPECCTGAWDAPCRFEALSFCCNTCGDNTSLCDNTYHVVSASETTDSVTIDGVIIEKGNAVGRQPNHHNGGGIYCPGVHIIIRDSTIRNNVSTQHGGGIYNNAGGSIDLSNCNFTDNLTRASAVVVSNGGGAIATIDGSITAFGTTFHNNQTPAWSSGAGAGGAILNLNSTSYMEECTFTNNLSSLQGSAISARSLENTLINCNFYQNINVFGFGGGGAINGSFNVIGCTFTENESSSGGAIDTWSVQGAIDTLIVNSQFVNNISNSNGGAILGLSTIVINSRFSGNYAFGKGGAFIGYGTIINSVFTQNSATAGGGAITAANFISANNNLVVVNSIFHSNSTDNNGGAVYYKDGQNCNVGEPMSLTNCTFYNNQANNLGGGIYLNCTNCITPSTSIENSIFWNNSDSAGTNTDESAQINLSTCALPTLDYNDIDGLTGSLGGLGNIGDDPLFVDAINGDLRLSSLSPLIDAGNNDFVPVDFLDLDEDSNTSELLPIDLDGQCRISDVTATPDTGNGIGPIVDMGAYEHTACACSKPPTPNNELELIRKSRYISFIPAPDQTDCNLAIRVTLNDLPDSFAEFEGQTRWVGEPLQYFEDQTHKAVVFIASRLQCEPYFTDWSTIDNLHVLGSEIIPGSEYITQTFYEEFVDQIDNEAIYSDPLLVSTGKWGDVVEPFAQPNLTQPSIADVLAVVDKWLGTLQPVKVQAQIQPRILNPSLSVGIADVLADVDAWLGTLYPYSGPEPCPAN